MFVSFKNQILDSTLDKNITNYNTIFSLIKIISENEFDVEKKINSNSFDVFYSLLYFLFLFKKEIYHLIEKYLYISNKFQEKQYTKENEFFDLFSKNISEKKKIYAKSDTQELISLYLFNEIMFQILNNKSIEDPSSIALFKNIVP